MCKINKLHLPTTSMRGLTFKEAFFLGASKVVNRSKFSKVSPAWSLGSFIENVPMVKGKSKMKSK